MEIKRQTIFYSATRYINCTKDQALSYYCRLTAINFDRYAAGKSQHSVEHCFLGHEGLLIAGTDYDAASLPADICAAIAELLNATNVDHVDITFCICSPIFCASSHRGGIVRVHRNGSTQLGSLNF
ncbi:MAG TPA: hypothetical protein DCR97_03435 [Deltaproteobacteria bacterium]|nr:hypothetical protein [Deltaproteobacteria bacterium]